jgi:8-oxo-dGTP diphosphatase
MKPRVPLLCRALAVVVEEGKVLLVGAKRVPGHWLPPGGKVDAREPADAAAVRETWEETGVRIRTLGLIAYREVWWEQQDVLELFFAGAVTPAEAPQEGFEPDHQWQWVEVARVAEVPHFPEELPELCRLAAGGQVSSVHLPPRDLREGGA